MNRINLEERLSRTVKMAMDNGEATTIDDAERIFQGYRLAIDVGPNVAESPTLQAALLTAINTGRRCFLGGVFVKGNIDVALKISWGACETLSEAVKDLRGKETTRIPHDAPLVAMGDTRQKRCDRDFAVRATFNGWAGGVIPLRDDGRLPENQEFTPAGVLAGALAVSEAFQYIRGGNQMVGRREVGLSLWKLDPGMSWMDPENAGPEIERLPSRLWLIGLGHLGQSFLWTMGFLPYARPEEVSLVLQDFDHLAEANDSTSPLTFFPSAKERKTRAMARWCEERGFSTSINERRFADDFQIAPYEPMVGVCGADNALARSALEDVGFSRIVEAGIGRGPQEYLAFQIHTFPGPQKAREKWGGNISLATPKEIIRKPAYETLARQGFDECGLINLADRSVGACFVGVTISTLLIAELLRMVHGRHAYACIDGNLRSLDHRKTFVNNM